MKKCYALPWKRKLYLNHYADVHTKQLQLVYMCILQTVHECHIFLT
jgi:hypothetical protein